MTIRMEITHLDVHMYCR